MSHGDLMLVNDAVVAVVAFFVGDRIGDRLARRVIRHWRRRART